MSQHNDHTDQNVALILEEISAGDPSGYERLFPLVMDQLRAMAQAQLRQERPDHTLQPTALVNEAYLRLADLNEMTWRDRAHFLGAASGAMRRILVDSARAKRRLKRGGDRQRLGLDHVDPAAASESEPGLDLERLDAAMEKLARLQPRQAKVVEMRYFGGATHHEIAEALGVSRRTVDLDWRMAREMLREFYEQSGVDESD